MRLLVIAALALLPAMPSVAGLGGDYTVIFRSGPNHVKTGKQCVTFTNTGNINGFPDSGTWESSTDHGWGGNFVVDGKILRWYGTFNGGSGATSSYNKISDDVPGGGGFDQWTVSPPPITAQNDGRTHFKAGCHAHPAHSSNPTQ